MKHHSSNIRSSFSNSEFCRKMICKKSTRIIRSFAYEFQPIYYFVRICGQMPFTITYHTKCGIVGAKMFKRDFIWLAITTCVQISFICLAFDMLKSISDPSAHTYNLYFGNLIVWFMVLLLGVCMAFLDACNRLKFVRMLNEVTVFDEEVSD